MVPLRMMLVVGSLLVAASVHADDLESLFHNPPDSTKPRCYWYWMDGHITKTGITEDLQAMERFGIGEAYIGIISGQSGMDPKPEPKALTDEWWDFIVHAVREAKRLGMDLGFFNSPGWSQSGGPWVQAEQAMRYVSLPEIRVEGPQVVEEVLPVPDDPFQDIAVLAFPAPLGETIYAEETSRSARKIEFSSDADFTARSLSLVPIESVKVDAELLASDDGKEYRSIKTFRVDRHNLNVNVGPVPLAPVTVGFPEVTAKHFRLVFSGPCKVGEIFLSPAARLESYPEKSLQKMFQDPLPPFDFYTWVSQAEPELPELKLDAAAVLNITEHMDSDGKLHWNVPAGEWVIVRAVMLPTGTKNSPSPEEATGFEVDKINRVPLKHHFDAYVKNLLDRLTADERTALKHVVADSYEMGPQNWTDGFAQTFEAAYGYDPLPWLPAMNGRIINSAACTDRFFWDLRRLVADLVSREYVGGLRDLCREQGLKMWLENYGHWGYPGEFLQYGGECDEISGEFWVNGDLGSVELRDAASAAHIYDHPIVWAEAFTGGIAFTNSPRDLKARGDWAFTEGINQFVLCLVIHQPWEDNLRRCSVLLQRGLSFVDAAYFIGEDAPKMTGLCEPALPAGYDFDYINADIIEKDLDVQDGVLVLPHGLSYRVLVLPPSTSMRPALLKKIGALAAGGAVVVGPAPDHSPSLENYPDCDEEVRALAEKVWSNETVLTDLSMEQVFSLIDLPPDVICPEDILWKHRQDGDTDIYFLSNQNDAARSETISFRITDKAPELWWAETGIIDYEPEFSAADGYTSLPIEFDIHTSLFVVFRKGKDIQERTAPEQSAPTIHTKIEGPWTVTFPFGSEEFPALQSWTDHAKEEIKYFSGEAIYSTAFTAPEKGKAVILELGEVVDIAVVRVNGQELGTLWMHPYKLDISTALQEGENLLEITVINPWRNRLVGDVTPGVKSAGTFTSQQVVKESTELKPAGLLGPVQIILE